MEWDQGSDTWVTLVSQSLGYMNFTYLIEAVIKPTKTYKFKYRAVNAYGAGDYSDIASIIAPVIPSRIDTVRVQFVGSVVYLNWDVPSSDGNGKVIAYRILIKQANGQFNLTSECNGNDTAILNSRECIIKFATLQAAPFNLTQDSLVVATVEALNGAGYSYPSYENKVGTKNACTSPTMTATESY